MKLLKNFFNFYLDASIHVALAVVSLAGVTNQMLNISSNLYLSGFIFCGTIVCYNFVKYGVEAEKYLIVSNVYQKNIQILSFLSFLLAFYFLLHLKKEIWIATTVLGFISTLYAVPLLPNAKNLRSLGGFKIYIVASVWAGFTVLLPALDAKLTLTDDIWLYLVQRFVLVLILILPFEIRDMDWDNKSLRTLPQVLGVAKTKALGILLIFGFFAMSFLKDDLTKKEVVSSLLVTIILIGIFTLKDKMKPNYFASFWVEGIPVIWFCSNLILNRIF
ncbi:hypothetical protein LV716_11570 [Flagellimonas sp. HMM57]|uniref:hypothetical protein n=1 Tax=unclassified Flagellimonas TaxID=2644544 RepID=UPI0013D36DDF|nr:MULTISPECIES: hypothetical protein [unclassified Flagellimonas]UII74896.1 hypothetical protein LV716_11570 [Flagellimonas sp. HMM57]